MVFNDGHLKFQLKNMIYWTGVIFVLVKGFIGNILLTTFDLNHIEWYSNLKFNQENSGNSNIFNNP